MIGRLGIDGGSVTTLGRPPNTCDPGGLGNKLGYMPQVLVNDIFAKLCACVFRCIFLKINNNYLLSYVKF